MSVTGAGTVRVPGSVLADTVLERLTATYAAAADPERAALMRAYMKDVAPFLGLTTPLRRTLSRTVLAGTPRPDEADCTAIALRCWELPEREYQYFAVDYLRRHVRQCTSGFLPVARYLVSTVPWWDTVDALASHVVGVWSPPIRSSSATWTRGSWTRTCGSPVRPSSTNCATRNTPTANASSRTACVSPGTP